MIEYPIIAVLIAIVFFILLGVLVLYTGRSLPIGVLCILVGAAMALFTSGYWLGADHEIGQYLILGGWVCLAPILAILVYIALDYFGVI